MIHTSEIDTFALERKTGYSGSFQQIAQITGTDIKSVTYTDNASKTDVLNFYRLSAVITAKIIRSLQTMHQILFLIHRIREMK